MKYVLVFSYNLLLPKCWILRQ